VLQWTNFIAKYPHAHVLVGRTRNIAHWRSSAVLKLIKAQNTSGQFSLRRTLDDEQGYCLILIGLELEADAENLARLLGARRVDAYAGYSSAFEFDLALLEPVQRRNRRTRVR
jgi:hypothetical protein